MPRPNNLIEQDLNMAPFGGGPQQVRFTLEGGLSILLYNNSGAPILKGTVVKADIANDESCVPVSAAGDLDPIGVAEHDIPTGAYGFIVVAGKAEVLIDNVGGCNREDWLGTSSTTAGYATASALPVPPTAAVHFQEIGHTLKARGSAGLVLAVVHFN